MRPRNLTRLRAALVVSILAGGSLTASAECLAGVGVCLAFTEAQVVALADVVEVQFPTVSLRVVETFKGTTGPIIALHRAGGPEDFKYVVGQRVLAYLRMTPEGLTSMCTRTGVEAEAGADIAAVRVLRDRRDGSWLNGRVQAPMDPALGYSPLVSGADVTLRQEGRVIQRVRTDGWGAFEFGWLTPGEYTADVGPSRYGGAASMDIIVTGDSKCLSSPPIRLPSRR